MFTLPKLNHRSKEHKPRSERRCYDEKIKPAVNSRYTDVMFLQIASYIYCRLATCSIHEHEQTDRLIERYDFNQSVLDWKLYKD